MKKQKYFRFFSKNVHVKNCDNVEGLLNIYLHMYV